MVSAGAEPEGHLTQNDQDQGMGHPQETVSTATCHSRQEAQGTSRELASC